MNLDLSLSNHLVLAISSSMPDSESKYGYPILELYELASPVTLSEMKTRWGMGGAPMGWRYLEAAMWEDRWGEDDARDEKAYKN
ncbi:hypothetical protein NM208_g680 [Fusarium decemcellulare]|uniref:Uncharacterized protein n=1 Tax=Fusarium decemcellulare TaxID=57161 RepID=A0ACC1SYI1_9HYPO|nr:hypothetical protein NM208_g680 [Fusarium decemcellulare]